MKRLYVVVRNDLGPGLQLAQACHAVQGFTREYAAVDVGDNLIALGAPPFALAQLGLHALLADLPIYLFFEPDLGKELTAIALNGEAQKLVASLPLALRAPRWTV